MLNFLLILTLGFFGLIAFVLFILSQGEGGLGRIFSTPEQDREAEAKKLESERVLQHAIANKDQAELQAIATARSLISKHLPALTRQRRILVTRNPYGIENTAKWDVEVRDFVATVVAPTIALESNPAFWHSEDRERIYELCQAEVQVATESNLASSQDAFMTNYDIEMSPTEYEHFCAERLRKDGWSANVTQASADQGADIIAQNGQVSLAIQCKQYAKPVGNGAVQEVVAAKTHYGTTHAIVIATAGFTSAARKLAETNGVALIHHDDIAQLRTMFV